MSITNTLYNNIISIQLYLEQQATSIINIVLLALALITIFIVAYLIESDKKERNYE